MRHPTQAELAGWQRAAQRAAASRAGAWFYVHVAPRIDRPLHRVSRGRLHTGLTWPVGVLHVRGAKSGRLRETPVLYLEDGDRVVLIASNGGSPRHPAWYFNLRANPDVTIRLRGGEQRHLRAREAEGEERERLWQRAVDLYAGYAAYQRRAGGRRIPVIVLEAPASVLEAPVSAAS